MRPLFMQSALSLLEPSPPACPRVFPGSNWPRAGLAANGREVLVMERAIGHIVLRDIVPDILAGPLDERVHFHEAELGVPAYDRRVSPRGGLVAPYAGYPATQVRKGLSQRDHLPYVAALVRCLLPELRAELLLHLGETPLGAIPLRGHAVSFLYLLQDLMGLLEEQVRVQIEYPRVRLYLHEHVDQDDILGP